MVRVRFAPSPTGIPHIGNTRTALYNWLFAKHQGGKFIVRIEDTDQERLVAGSLEKILGILKFVGIVEDEGPKVGGNYGPYIQSQRLNLYKDCAERLVKQGVAYYEDKAIRLKMPSGEKFAWDDLIQGKIEFTSDGINDPVLLKSDGFPTYHLAVVVDDHLMEITHILRGAEWISSTPKHLWLYRVLGWQPPQMGHFSVILGPDKAKLSKRHGAKSVLDYRDEGYLPEALVTFMAYLGWSYEDNSRLMTLTDLVKQFDLKQVHKANPIFDQKKLDWFNAKLIRQMPLKELTDKLAGFMSADCDKDLADKILPLVQERLVKLSEWEPLTAFFYREITLKPGVLVKKSTREEVAEQLGVSLGVVREMSEWRAELLEEKFRQVAIKQKWQPGQFFMMLRVGVTGRSITPPLFATMEVLGKEKVLNRLAHAQDTILQ